MIDLHTHTNCSDGIYTPRELIQLAKKRRLSVIAITDHDTIDAYRDDITSYAQQLGVLLISGIEFSSTDELTGEKIHVIGLNIDVKNSELVELCDRIRKYREDNLLLVAEKLKQIGIILRSEKLLKSGFIITKSHIAQDILSNPDNEKILLNIYGKIPFKANFIVDYLIKGKPAFVGSVDKLVTNYAVNIIKNAGGKAFCAHPTFNVIRGFDIESMEQLILRNKFDGLETINIQYDKENNDEKIDMVKIFSDFAKENNLLVSGGSDYHSNDVNLMGNHSDLGLSNEDHRITHQELAAILKS